MGGDLQDRENWDFEKAESRAGSKKSRAVVSVAFSAKAFQEVAQAAADQRMKTSEFIRNAALDEARKVSKVVRHFGFEPVSTVGPHTIATDLPEAVSA